MVQRLPLWLPYLREIKETKAGVLRFTYKGGVEEIKITHIASIMIYGKTDEPFYFPIFERLTRAGIPIIYTRRNIAQPMIIYGAPRFDREDTLTHHIVTRENVKKKTHIARQLLVAKMQSMRYLVAPFDLPKTATVEQLRHIEARHAKDYWQAYFASLGHPEWTRRGEETGKNPVAKSLDAASRFISGIILRWVLYHNLSPIHGFLHVTTDYQSLIYDLMEPYRGIFEQVLLTEVYQSHVHLLEDEERLINVVINTLKAKYNSKCYVPMTRQIVTYHELLHGAVLSLKYYMLGKQRKYLIPLPGRPKGGRPAKVPFRLYGRQAGKTDFWHAARQLSEEESDEN